MKTLTTISLLFFFTFVSFGQTFSSDWQTVPKNFNGNDPEAIYRSLSDNEKSRQKDEFETTEQFNARVNNPENLKIGVGLNAGSQLVFVYRNNAAEINLSRGLEGMYNADTQTFTVNLKIEEVKTLISDLQGRRDFKNFFIASVRPKETSNIGTYVGSNSYGVERTVTKYLITEYSLAINNLQTFSEYSGGRYSVNTAITKTFNLPPEEAKSFKENLGALFVFKLISPFTTLKPNSIKATIDSPREITAGNYILIGNASEIWLFNTLTGKVYGKLKGETSPVYEKGLDKPAELVSLGVINGKAANLVQPEYPPVAKAVRATGAVNVEVEVDESGNVVAARSISGHPLLRYAAETAARACKFTPTILSGEAVRIKGIIVYNFVAQ